MENLLNKEIKAFKEKFVASDGLVHDVNGPIESQAIESFFRASLLRFARSVIEEAMPETAHRTDIEIEDGVRKLAEFMHDKYEVDNPY